MKQLSIEEKVKRYDEALKKVKDMLSYKEVRREDMEYLFPELKESEDERIRKELLAWLKSTDGQTLPMDRYNAAIAWLEKQGEQKSHEEIVDEINRKAFPNHYGGAPVLDIEIPFGAKDSELEEVNYSIPNGYHAEIEDNKVVIKKGEQKPVELTDLRTWKYIVDAVLTEREGIGQYIDSPWTTEVAEKLQKRFGNIEQKPVEYVNGEDYGIDGLYVAMDILNKTLGQVEGYQSDDGILEHKAAMTAVKKLYKQKPIELEKEEKSRLMKKCVHKAYQQGYDTGFHMATTELEHKQEWSEEDDKIRSSIIDFIRYELNHSAYIGTAGVDSARQIEWLKSLRPQNKWKPSDEQIRELSIVATGKGWFSKEILRELLEQLKKLRKE